MKPKEFDELVRQKFDQNDFAYEPRNWNSLAEQLEGRAKKRSLIMWWWMPLAGMAASVALALGVTSTIRLGIPTGTGANTEIAQTNSFILQQRETPAREVAAVRHTHKTRNIHSNLLVSKEARPSDWFHVRLRDNDNAHTPQPARDIDLALNATPVKYKKNVVLAKEAINTFKPDEAPKKEPKLSVILSGGVNHGSQNSGYMAGATIRRMINDRVYVEGDVAFASSTNTQSTAYLAYVGTPAAKTAEMRHGANYKTGAVESYTAPANAAPSTVIKDMDVSYNLSYIQVTPSLGIKIMKRMSIGAGPDFQQVLADNRPTPSTVERGNIQVAPLFDIGLIGKTEYAVTKRVKAAVYYRKGINNIVTPMDKYIERDYLQFQLKCTVFKK